MYIPKTLHEENVHNNCLMGLIFWTSWSVAPKKIKISMGIWIFQKKFQKYRILGSSLDPKFEIFTLFIWFDFLKDFKPKTRAKRAVSGEAARSREAANSEVMYIQAVSTQAFSASSLQFVSTPYFLVVDTVAVGSYSTKVNCRHGSRRGRLYKS